MFRNFAVILSAAIVLMSCGGESTEESNESEEQSKYDKNSADYKMAEVLCDCFVSFEDDDPAGQLEAVDCMMEKMNNDVSLEDADEDKTIEIVNEICPETAVKLDKWLSNME